jgi:hypothetical protein
MKTENSTVDWKIQRFSKLYEYCGDLYCLPPDLVLLRDIFKGQRNYTFKRKHRLIPGNVN